MAILDVNLGSSDQTISSANASDGDVINITALGSYTLTVDGVDVSIDSIVGVSAASAPTFAAVNGGSLTIDQGILSVDLLDSMTFSISDTSSIELDGSTVSALTTLLDSYTVEFSGSEAGSFTYTPSTLSVLSSVTFDVDGMDDGDTLTVSDRSDLEISSYDPSSETLTLYSDGTLGLGQGVTFVISGVTQADYDAIEASLSDADDSNDLLTGSTFTFPSGVACFVLGTTIHTPSGEVPIETLKIGDPILTRDDGVQRIAWIGSTRIGPAQLALMPALRPIRIRAGALGNTTPTRDLLVSPQHRVLVRSKIALRMFGTEEVLVAAKQLLHLDGIEIAEEETEVKYFHLMCTRHQIVFANGAEAESLYAGPIALQAIGHAARDELYALFPELRAPAEEAIPESARRLVPGRLARKLALRHAQNKRALVTAV